MSRWIAMVALVSLASCAHQSNLKTTAQRARLACDALRRSTLRAPVRTDIAGGLARVEAERAAGNADRARALAAELVEQCAEEAERRQELAPLVEMVDRDPERIPASRRAPLDRLLARSDYSGSMVCAEALLQGDAARCPGAPAVSARLQTQRLARIDDEGVARPLPTSQRASSLPARDSLLPAAPLPSATEGEARSVRRGDRELLQPPSQVLFPTMGGALDSHIDFQLGTTWYDGAGVSTALLLFGLEVKLALADRVELGLNLPFLTSIFRGGGMSSSETHVGAMEVGVKVKLAGSSEGPYAVSLYCTTYLPTFTGTPILPLPRFGDLQGSSRDFAFLRLGAATSVGVGPVTLMGGFGFLDLIDGSYQDYALLVVDVAAAVRAHRMLAPYVGFHLLEGVYPGSGTPGVALSLGLRLLPLAPLHVDLGARIGLNDPSGLVYNGGGRTLFLFAVGYRFR